MGTKQYPSHLKEKNSRLDEETIKLRVTIFGHDDDDDDYDERCVGEKGEERNPERKNKMMSKIEEAS